MTFDNSFQNLPGTRTPKTRYCRGVYQIMLLMFSILIAYWIFLTLICGLTKVASCDRINRVLFNTKAMGEFGGWSLTHIIFYYFVGLLFPDCILIAMTVGVIWEIFEEVLGSVKPSNIGGVTKSSSLQYKHGWIRGTLSDVVYNFIGFVAGALTTKYFLKGEPPKVPWLSTD